MMRRREQQALLQRLCLIFFMLMPLFAVYAAMLLLMMLMRSARHDAMPLSPYRRFACFRFRRLPVDFAVATTPLSCRHAPQKDGSAELRRVRKAARLFAYALAAAPCERRVAMLPLCTHASDEIFTLFDAALLFSLLLMPPLSPAAGVARCLRHAAQCGILCFCLCGYTP